MKRMAKIIITFIIGIYFLQYLPSLMSYISKKASEGISSITQIAQDTISEKVNDIKNWDVGESIQHFISGVEQQDVKQESTTDSVHITDSSRIKDAQEKLNRLGFDAGAVDGIWGPKTQSALNSYQGAYSLKKTDYLDVDTYNSLTNTLISMNESLPRIQVQLNSSNLIMKVGESNTLIATLSPNSFTNSEIIWNSSNEKVATVHNGIVASKKEGKTIITAETADGSANSKCEIIVLSAFDYAFTEDSYVEQYVLQRESMYMAYDIYENTVADDFLRLGITGKEMNKNKSSIGQHKVGYVIGQKKLYDGKMLYVVVIRGTYSEYNMNEWISNFNIQETGDAFGFIQAANEVADAIKKQYIDIENCKILFTGHSRGAAVANYLAGYWAREYGIKAEDIYAYTFACPNVVLKDKQPNYTGGGIYNYNFMGDPVTKVPFADNWGFTRYGTTRDYNIPVLHEHLGLSLVQYNKTIDLFTVLLSVDRKYYHQRIFPFIADVFLFIDGEENKSYIIKRGIEFLSDMAENHPEVFVRLNDYCEKYNLKGDKLFFSDDSTLNRFLEVFEQMGNTHLQSTYLNAVNADYWGIKK